MPPKKKAVDFEQSLAELEALVARMEQGDMSLEESLKAFGEGINLTRECQNRLAEAELKVNQLINDRNEFKLEPFFDADDQTKE